MKSTKTIYVANADWNNDVIVNYASYKIVFKKHKATITRYQQDYSDRVEPQTKESVTIDLLSDETIVSDFVLYKKDFGLFLDDMGMNENIFGMSPEIWKEAHKLACNNIINLEKRDCDASYQLLSTKRSHYDGTTIITRGNTQLSGIKMTNFGGKKLMVSSGGYSNICEILGIEKSECNIPLNIDWQIGLSEGSTFTLTNTAPRQTNVSNFHEGKPMGNCTKVIGTNDKPKFV